MTSVHMEEMSPKAEQRFQILEGKMAEFEALIASVKKQPLVEDGSFTHQIVEHLSVVGLKEALTSTRPSLKYTWAALLCLGSMATVFYIYSTTAEFLANPTATNVELRRPATFDYPYLVVCSWAWLDIDKATSKGLSMDAIKYSLAYVDEMIVDESVNLTSARAEFLEFYNRHNYTGLIDYYRDVATDLVERDGYMEFADYNSSCYYCSDCVNGTNIEKIPLDSSLCYAFSFSSVDGDHYHGISSPNIGMKIQDKTRTTFGISSNFRIFLMPDKNLTVTTVPAVAMESGTSMTFRTSTQAFVSLKDEKHPCALPNEIPANYSAERCHVTCVGEAYKRSFGCYFFYYSANDHHLHPQGFCNYADPQPGTNTTVYEMFLQNESSIFESVGETCIKQCPEPCERTIVTSVLDSKFTIKQSAMNAIQKAAENNMSFLDINIHNSAIMMGGILTFTEMSTFSLSTLVSNVGGTLGLFLGGTLFTIFQIIMFGVNYILDRNEKRRLRQTTSANSANGGPRMGP